MTRPAAKISKETRRLVLLQLSMNVPKKFITELTGLSFYLIQRIIAEEKAAKQLRKEEKRKKEQKQLRAKKTNKVAK